MGRRSAGLPREILTKRPLSETAESGELEDSRAVVQLAKGGFKKP
jgi:hypothetical protein